MKNAKKVSVALIVVLVGIMTVSAAGSYYMGPNGNLLFSWKTGVNIFKGKYVTGKLEGYGNQKHVTSRYSHNYVYSGWKSETDFFAEATAYGAITSGDYSSTPEWK